MGKIDSKKQQSKSGEIITLRNATVHDAEKLYSLVMEISSSSDYLIVTPEEYSLISSEQQIARIKRHKDNDGDIWLVAEHNNELIGTIDFQNGKSKKTNHKGSFGLIVKPSWQNKGIGKILLSALSEWVEAHSSIEVINLTVSEENTPAIALYKNFGFQITGREPFGLKLQDGRFLVDLTMTLKH